MNSRDDRSLEAPQALLMGFPATTSRGYLGWSTVALFRRAGKTVLLDTGGPGDRPGLLAALKTHGLEPADVDTVVLSHLHFDHALNLELFREADVYVHKAELDYAKEYGLKDLALCQWATSEISQHPRLIIVEGEPELFDGVRVMYTPGHTMGCISLAMEVAGETWILAQDAVKNRRELATGSVEMAVDRDAASKSLLRIRDLAHVVMPGHDVPLRIRGSEITALAEATLEITEVVTGRSTLLKTGGL